MNAYFKEEIKERTVESIALLLFVLVFYTFVMSLP